jgi:aminocarboxymuconate-semialdehyde decarboxylase
MTKSRYMLFSNFGWPYETSAAMTHIVFAGLLEKYPNLKIITHHCGAMIPFFEERIIGAYDHAMQLRGAPYARELTKPPIEYFKRFYADTAVYGSTPALMCGLAFFGIERMVFGTDMPYDSEMGDRYTRQTIHSIERMPISEAERKIIFETNARKLLRLEV